MWSSVKQKLLQSTQMHCEVGSQAGWLEGVGAIQLPRVQVSGGAVLLSMGKPFLLRAAACGFLQYLSQHR